MKVEFVGKRGALFWLALKTGFLTVLTLGFYRFWMKTRLRRWYWSAIRPGGDPMEYVGDPIEKLLGFFIAVVILTFYIGVLNLVLMFLSFSLFSSSVIGYAASFAGVIPLWFYARYRARRYVLARTRWRGVRFGLEPGAWGYAGRALLYWALTIVTLGLLWPRMTFLLEKYRTDRTFFGSVRLIQGGHWTMLYRAAVPFIIALVLCGGWAFWLILVDPLWPTSMTFDGMIDTVATAIATETPVDELNRPGRLFLLPAFLMILIYGAVHYRWVSKRLMADAKHAPGVTFQSRLRAPRVFGIYLLGNFLAYLVLVFGIMVMILLALPLMFAEALDPQLTASMDGWASLPRIVHLLALGLLYLAAFLLWGVLHNTFVTFPLMRHMAQTTTLPEMRGLQEVSQRERDAFAEAEGFAEALDLGAAI